MTYAIIAFVVVVVLFLLVLFLRKPAGRLPPAEASRSLEGAEPPAPGRAQPPRTEAEPKQTTKPERDEAKPKQPVEREPELPVDVEEISQPAAPKGSVDRGEESKTAEPPSSQATPSVAPKRDVPGLRKGLAKARSENGFLGRLAQLFVGKREIDPNIADQIEEILLTSDVGVTATQAILERIRDGLSKKELSSPQAVWDALRTEAARILTLDGGRLRMPARPTVVFVVGVNGVGKTTSIGKIATKLVSEGKSVILAAGDTFRAAAVQQLEIWGRRVGCETVKGKEGADPGAVIFDAIQKAKENHIDVVLADSAGRLQTKTPLMDELKKISRTMQKALDGAPHETLLVLDATNGQNATSQAKMFQEAIPLTGIILTKLDGTAKGGVILGICDELKIPVRYVGIGERAEDLREFIADEFVDALFGRTADETAAA